MKCFCGCGAELPKRHLDANLQASEVALELLVWDRARVIDPGSSSEAVESLIVRGAGCYRRLLSTLHDEREVDSPLAEGQRWLQESHDQRWDRDDMTKKGSLLSKGKLKVSNSDLERLDRAHPETSFSATRSQSEDAESPDVVAQIERLGALYANGLLSDEEFSAAKERVLG